MGLFSGMSRTSGHKPGQEEEAIQTLSNRLQHASLSADRKSAVLGLKSFSRQFREPVVQHGLRALLLTLGKDYDNAPVVKAVLETLLILFLRGEDASEDQALGWILNQSRVQNGKYPSPLLVERISLDEFSDWIADEMILSDEHIKVLMDIFQEHQGFQVRMFSLQLLEAVVATRPERAKDCVINTPLAVSTIVGLLDDPNDPIRNETILLLMALVNHNFNIQKLVAFENTFEKIFEIIEEEGGIRGSILVQDCMTLLTNLLRYNASNQKFFLEADCVPKLARLIAEPLEDNQYPENDPILSAPIIWTDQRLQNMTIALEICESFVDSDNQELARNQEILFSCGIFFSVLKLVFSPVTEIPIRKTALKVTGGIIANNPDLQYQFALIDVPYMDPSMPMQLQTFDHNIPAPLALLNWTLVVNSVHLFEVRVAALQCLIAYLKGNEEAKLAFITDQIKASKNPNHYSERRENDTQPDQDAPENQFESIPSGENPNKTPYANIFTTLTVYDSDMKLNPYRVWFAAVLLLYISQDSPETKLLMRKTKIGDAEEGEEEMCLIQALSGMLITNLDNSDPRIAIGYLILLTLWMYEDFDAVNDFLGDPSMIKAILAFLTKNSTESSDLVHGMCCIVTGVCFEFTTKSSPVPRANLYDLITKALGADHYSQKVKQFKDNSLFKRFELECDLELDKDSTGLPALFFIPEYVELVKDNFYRIRKALIRGPEFEPRSRISFEVFEELENKNVGLRKELETLQKLSQECKEQLKLEMLHCEKELESITKSLEACRSELDETKQSEQALTTHIEELSGQLKVLQSEKSKCDSSLTHYTNEYNRVSKLHGQDEEVINSLKLKLMIVEASKQKAEDGINKMSRELFQLTKEQKESQSKIASQDQQMKKIKDSLEAEIQKYRVKAETAHKANQELKAKLQMVQEKIVEQPESVKIKELQTEISQWEEKNDSLMEKLRAAASVVQELRHEKTQLQQNKNNLEIELIKAYEDLEALSNVLDEVRELREGTDSVYPDNIEALKKQIESVTKEKSELESQLESALKNLEDLTATANESSKNRCEAAPSKEDTSVIDESANYKEQILRLKSELEELQAIILQLQESFERQKEDLIEQLNTIKSQEQDMKNGQETSEQSSTRNLHENTEESSLKNIQETLAEPIPEIVQDKNLQAEIDYLKEQLDKKSYDLGLTETRMKHLESNIEILSQSASSSLASFKQSQDNLKTRIIELEEEKREMMEEIEMLKQTYSEASEKQQDELDDMENTNMDLELKNSNLEKNRDELLQKLTKLEKDSALKIQMLSQKTEELEQLVEKTKAEKDRLNSEYIELEKLTNIISSELQAKEALLQAMNNKGGDLAAKDKIVIEIKERLAHAISELGECAQSLRVVTQEKSELQKLHLEEQARVEALNSRILELESEIESNADNLEQTRAEKRKLSSLLTEYIDLKKAYNENVEKTASLELEKRELQEALKIKTNALQENKRVTQESSQAAIAEYTERISKLEFSLLQNQKSHDQELSAVRDEAKEKIEELSQKATSLENVISQSHQQEITNEETLSLQQELASVNDKLGSCRLELDEKKSQIKELSTEIEDKTKTIDSLVAEKQDLQETTLLNEDSEKMLQKRNTGIEEQLREQIEQNQSSALEVEKLTAKLVSLETELQEKEDMIAQVQRRVSQEMAERARETMDSDEVINLRNGASELEAKLELANHKCQQLESQLERVTEELQGPKGDNDSQATTEQQLQQAKLEKESAQKDLYDMMILYEEQEKQLQEYTRRMEALDMPALSDDHTHGGQ